MSDFTNEVSQNILNVDENDKSKNSFNIICKKLSDFSIKHKTNLTNTYIFNQHGHNERDDPIIIQANNKALAILIFMENFSNAQDFYNYMYNETCNNNIELFIECMESNDTIFFTEFKEDIILLQ